MRHVSPLFVAVALQLFVPPITFCAADHSRFIKSFKKLSYDAGGGRKRRAAGSKEYSLRFDFEVPDSEPERYIRVELWPAGDTVFSPDHVLVADGAPVKDQRPYSDILYEGRVIGDRESHVYGSVIDNVFDGHIFTGDGRLYHVERVLKYLGHVPDDYHSIIYEDNAIDYSKFNQKDNQSPEISRTKRDAQKLSENEVNSNDFPDSSVENNGDSFGGFAHCGLTQKLERYMSDVEHSAVDENDQTGGERVGQISVPDGASDEAQSLLGLPSHLDSSEPAIARYRRGLETFAPLQSGTRPKLEDVNGKRLYDARTCSLYLQADHKLYEEIYKNEGLKTDQRTREEILALFFSHVKAVNRIYESTSFGGVTGVNFVVQRTTIFNSSSCNENGTPKPGSDNPFCDANVDVSSYLNLNSVSNHSAFCLAYALTYRDFMGGTLGLAWVASPQPNTAGGICQVYQRYNERRGWVWRSLNTGIITLVNYGHRVPARVSQLTLAHEIGHNFGSPHDYPRQCQPGLPDGNYIMYASATSGDKRNNAEFSHCSKNNISSVLYAVLAEVPVDPQKHLHSPSGGKRNCFSARTTAFCGNNLVEPGEQCDCGFTAEDCARMGDRCCYPHKVDALTQGGAAQPQGCRRKPSARCSPSEGPCCDSNSCGYLSPSQMCSMEDECNNRQYCAGFAASCPVAEPKSDGTPCQENTKICQGGVCNMSICHLVGLDECFITEGTPEQRCELACKKHSRCMSSFDLPELSRWYQKWSDDGLLWSGDALALNSRKMSGAAGRNAEGILLRPGAPCDNYRGYCDIYRKCRSVDSNGPLSRLKNFFLNPETYDTALGWAQDHWWAVVLAIVGLLALLALFIKCFAVHTPSTNPNKPPAHNIYETLRHPSTLIHPRHQRRRRAAAAASNGTAAAAPPSNQRSGSAQAAVNAQAREREPRSRRTAAPPQQQLPPVVVGPRPGANEPVAPLAPPSEPPPSYLAAVGRDPTIAVPPGGPKRGHRKNRRRGAGDQSNSSASAAAGRPERDREHSATNLVQLQARQQRS